MSDARRLLEAVAGVRHHLTHTIDPDSCPACVRFDELQGAALAAVGAIEAEEARRKRAEKYYRQFREALEWIATAGGYDAGVLENAARKALRGESD
jgi:hypothetical protein